MNKIYQTLKTENPIQEKKVRAQRLFQVNSATAFKTLLVLGGIFIAPSLSVNAKTNIYPTYPRQILLSQVITTAPNIVQSTKRLVFNDVQGGVASAARSVTLRNTGNADLTIDSLRLSGTDANQFQITQQPTLPITIAPGSFTTVSIAFNPTTIGPKGAQLQITSNDPNTPKAAVNLRGLGTLGLGGKNEPSLQWILDTYEIPINVGDSDSTNNFLSTDTPSGDEVSLPQFQKAGKGSVTVQVIGVFAPKSSSGIVARFGYYNSGNAASTHQLFTVPNYSYQSLNPSVLGSKSFDPGVGNFGFYSIWPIFNDREVYSEAYLNTSDTNTHQVRVYPLKTVSGSVVPNAYILTTEEHSNYDYQDIVVIVRNVKPATTVILQN